MEERWNKRFAALDPLPFDSSFSYVVDWFYELAAGRQCGMGINPIAWADLQAWAQLTGRAPNVMEVALLRRIDATYVSVMNEKGEDDAPPAPTDRKLHLVKK